MSDSRNTNDSRNPALGGFGLIHMVRSQLLVQGHLGLMGKQMHQPQLTASFPHPPATLPVGGHRHPFFQTPHLEELLREGAQRPSHFRHRDLAEHPSQSGHGRAAPQLQPLEHLRV